MLMSRVISCING